VPHIDFAAPDFASRLGEAFVARGVVVIEGVFSAAECDGAMVAIVGAFEQLSPGLRRADPRTWTRANCPPQTRVGLYQCLIANLAPVWRLRADPRTARIFETLYSSLRGRPVTDFVVSGDGLNLKPNLVGP
jgi:hypothetical protein